MSRHDLEAELDRLYGLPLSEFVAARNELAKELRAAGERRTADRVKALAKPSVTAWAVNALFHHERRRFEGLLEAAAAVRAALAGEGDRRRAEKRKRQALQELLARAAELLTKAGHSFTPSSRQRIGLTLESLAAREPETDEPRLGRLSADLEPQGFDVLAGLAASLAPGAAARPPRRVFATDQSAQPRVRSRDGADPRLQEARREVAERQAALEELEAEASAASAAADEAKRRHQQLAEEALEAERRAQEAVEALARAKADLAAKNQTAAGARKARRAARLRLATARRKLDRLGG